MRDWLKARAASFAMEQEIREDMLLQGVNGLEWLVLHTKPTEMKIRSLNNWLEFANKLNLDFHSIMKDAVVMDSESFYEKHELNWWIAIDETITYLCLLRQRDYDSYFRFTISLERS